jgi:hypothetical protein
VLVGVGISQIMDTGPGRDQTNATLKTNALPHEGQFFIIFYYSFIPVNGPYISHYFIR